MDWTKLINFKKQEILGDLKYKIIHRLKELCYDCSRKVALGRTRCKQHLQSRLNSSKTYQEKNRIEGKCISCGIPLHPEADIGKEQCTTCRDRSL